MARGAATMPAAAMAAAPAKGLKKKMMVRKASPALRARALEDCAVEFSDGDDDELEACLEDEDDLRAELDSELTRSPPASAASFSLSDSTISTAQVSRLFKRGKVQGKW